MGRRALPRINPDVEFSQNLVPLIPGETRFTPAEWFPNDAPLELEIGSGKGLFLLHSAERFPDRNFLGVEIAKKYAAYGAYRLAQQDVTNAVMMSGNALPFVEKEIPSNSLDGVHIYFPDPWWKQRHRKRRVVSIEFVPQIQRVLKPGCPFHFWTDVEGYFEESLKILAKHTTLEGPFDVEEQQPSHDLDYRTHFERRMRKHGKPIYRSIYRKPLTEANSGESSLNQSEDSANASKDSSKN